MQQKNVSIIIVSYFTGASLWMCIYRALQLDGGKEVIIVSNGNEAVVELRLRQLEEENPRVTVLIGHGNIGFGRGCNLGAEKATGDYLLFLNPDSVMMEKDAPLRMSALFKEDCYPPVGLVGGILRNDDGSEQRGSRRNIITPANALIEGSGLHLLRGVPFPVINLNHLSMPQQPSPIGAVSGACMMMERERFNQIGRFDEEYFLHVEDMDLCLRVHKAGGGVWVRPDVNALHYRSTSDVKALFVERMKTKGFYRYFDLHYHFKPVLRPLAIGAVALNLAVKIIVSLFKEYTVHRLLTDAKGIKRVQAIVRGMNAVRGRNAKSGLGRTVLVTGASSQVGLFTVGRLLADGYRVIALTNRTYIGFFHPNLAWVRGNLNNPETLAQNLRYFRCDAVIHCAPVWMASGAVPVFCGIGAKKIVVLSSTSLLTKKESASVAERKVVERLEQGEEQLKAAASQVSMGWTILRPTMIYGAGLDNNITRVANELDIHGRFYLERPANGLRAPVHADDLALTAIRAMDTLSANGQIYNVQGGESLSYYDMVNRIGQALVGKRYRIFSIPKLSKICGFLHACFPTLVPSGDIVARMQKDQLFPDERLRSELGLEMRPFLHEDLIDLGLASESTCRKLLDIYVENAAYFVSSVPQPQQKDADGESLTDTPSSDMQVSQAL